MFAVIKRRTAPPVILFIFLVQRKTLEVISAVVTILIAIMRRHFTCTKMKIVFYFLQCDQRAIEARAHANDGKLRTEKISDSDSDDEPEIQFAAGSCRLRRQNKLRNNGAAFGGLVKGEN